MLIFENNPDAELVAKARENEDVIVMRLVSEEEDPDESLLREFVEERGFSMDEPMSNLAVFVSPPTETDEDFQERVQAIFDNFLPEGMSTLDAIRAVMETDDEVDIPEWIEQYVGRMFDVWQLQHGMVEFKGREAAIEGITHRMIDRPDLDEIPAEDLSIEATKVFFGILAFSGGVEDGASECLNRIVYRLLSMPLGIAQHNNEMHDAGEKSSFVCPCCEL